MSADRVAYITYTITIKNSCFSVFNQYNVPYTFQLMSAHMKVFIDTEFTDFIDCHLISLGMVTERDEEFYAEVPYPDKACSAFVREVVLKLIQLVKYPDAKCEKDELRSRILDWLKLVRRGNEVLEICYDYQTDWDLFADALDGDIPSFIKPRLVNSEISDLLFEQFFEHNRDHYQHHALHDAKANAYAFRERIMSLSEIMTGIPNFR